MAYLAIMAFAWGKGETEDEALANMRKAACEPVRDYKLYTCGPTARVDESGCLVYRPAVDSEPELVRTVKNGKVVSTLADLTKPKRPRGVPLRDLLGNGGGA